MKKLFCILLMLTLLFSAAACGSKADAKSADTNVTKEETAAAEVQGEEAAAVEEPIADAGTEEVTIQQESAAFDPTDIYSQCIADYRQAVEEQIDGTTLAQANMCTNIILLYAEEDPLSKIGYFKYDFDEDGIDELLIGPIYDAEKNNEGVIYHLLTVDPEEGTYKDVFVAKDNDQLYLCKDYSFVREFAPADDISEYMIMDKTLKTTEIIQREATSVFDFEKKEFYSVSNWTHIDGDGGEESVVETISADQAIDMIADICENYMQIPYTPLSE